MLRFPELRAVIWEVARWCWWSSDDASAGYGEPSLFASPFKRTQPVNGVSEFVITRL